MKTIRERLEGETDDELRARLEAGRDLVEERINEVGRRRLAECAPLVHSYLFDPHPDVRSAAAEVVGEMGFEAAVPALIALLTKSDETVEVRDTAAYALGQLRADAAVPALLEALRSADRTVRLCSMAALAGIGDSRAHAAIMTIARLSPDEEARAQAGQLLHVMPPLSGQSAAAISPRRLVSDRVRRPLPVVVVWKRKTPFFDQGTSTPNAPTSEALPRFDRSRKPLVSSSNQIPAGVA